LSKALNAPSNAVVKEKSLSNKGEPFGNDERWEAVQVRDQRYDSLFVYGVLSTGIYCRPSCPSRRPGKEKVIFFPDPSLAEKAGFRPCKRCKPNEKTNLSPQASWVEKLCNYIKKNFDKKLTLKSLSEKMGVSPFYLQRTFKRVTAVTPRQYAEAFRLDHLKIMLRDGKSVRRSIYDAGYNSVSSLYSRPGAKLGMQPGVYKRGGEGVKIWYLIADCFLGRLLVAWTRYGVCGVSLGDSDDKLLQALRNEYPQAKVQESHTQLTKWISAILRYMEGEESGRHLIDMPLDVKATTFKRRVWKELQSIPYGSTLSYGEIAKRISIPKGSRAVASACASNPVAIVIPCHRAIRRDGSLGGYRWGVERKKSLLEMENSSISQGNLIMKRNSSRGSIYGRN